MMTFNGKCKAMRETQGFWDVEQHEEFPRWCLPGIVLLVHKASGGVNPEPLLLLEPSLVSWLPLEKTNEFGEVVGVHAYL